MKIKIQQLVEKVRRSPSDNGSFEVQSKFEETEAYCWQVIVHFAFIQLFPPHHFKFRVATRRISFSRAPGRQVDLLRFWECCQAMHTLTDRGSSLSTLLEVPKTSKRCHENRLLPADNRDILSQFFLSIQRSLRGVLESHLSLYGTIMSLLNVMWNCTFCQCLLIRESFMALLHVVRVRLLWNSPCCCSPFTVMYICQFCFHGFCTCSVPSMTEWIRHEKKSKWQNFRCKITLWVWKWIFFPAHIQLFFLKL